MESYKKNFSNKSFTASFVSGVILMTLGCFAQYYSSIYATYASSQPVTDIILSNTRVYNVGGIFVWGAVVLFLITCYIGLKTVNYAPFTMKSIATFTIIRSVFVSLTHLAPFPTKVVLTSNFFTDKLFNGIFTGNDLFFSGHTGLPFLFALIFWESKPLRYMYLTFSFVFAVVVLLGHLHYSIDVLAAYFITYTIFQICKWMFPKDWKFFQQK